VLLLPAGHKVYPAPDGRTDMDTRAALEAEDLLKIILVLVVVWIAVEIVGEIIGAFTALLGPFRPVLGLLIVVLIVLWLLDRI
jgi:hypothetical protein